MAKGRLRLRELQEWAESGEKEITPSKYHEGHEDRILGHIRRVHEQIGPVSGEKHCNCVVCEEYRLHGTCGERHKRYAHGCKDGCCDTEAKKRAYHKAYQRRWQKEHREEIQAKRRKYYAENREDMNNRQKAYRKANPDKQRKWQKDYRERLKNERKEE